MTETNDVYLFSKAQKERISRRAADELIGLACGITADGVVNLSEAQFLQGRLKKHLSEIDDPIINMLFTRVNNMLEDGILDEVESKELLETLKGFAGVTPSDKYTAPNDLPFSNPAPTLEWKDKVYVFTGTMAYGPRKDCETLASEKGAHTAKDVSRKVDYLVVGSIGNDQWKHSSYGRKIIKAVELQHHNHQISIINEDYFLASIFS